MHSCARHWARPHSHQDEHTVPVTWEPHTDWGRADAPPPFPKVPGKEKGNVFDNTAIRLPLPSGFTPPSIHKQTHYALLSILMKECPYTSRLQWKTSSKICLTLTHVTARGRSMRIRSASATPNRKGLGSHKPGTCMLPL